MPLEDTKTFVGNDDNSISPSNVHITEKESLDKDIEASESAPTTDSTASNSALAKSDSEANDKVTSLTHLQIAANVLSVVSTFDEEEKSTPTEQPSQSQSKKRRLSDAVEQMNNSDRKSSEGSSSLSELTGVDKSGGDQQTAKEENLTPEEA